MATYKVSYKMLAKQGDELKAVAKLIDGYAERVNQIRGKLGDNETLAAVRNNLSKFKDQLTESRTVLSVAGGLLTSTVEKYTAVETRQVKNVDSYKAHNRDFYKNPVVVASAGGAGAGAVAAGMPSGQVPPAATVSASTPAAATVQTATPVQTASAPAETTINYTENNTVNYTQVNVINEAAPAAPIDTASAVPMSNMAATSAPKADRVAAAVAPAAAAAAPAAAAPAAAGLGGGAVAVRAAGAGLAGAALGAGAVLGAKHLADNNKSGETKKPDGETVNTSPESETDEEYDPEKELAAALERVRQLSEEE
jgi:hypothetical protein